MRVRRGKTRRKNAAYASLCPILRRRKAYLKRAETLLSAQDLLLITPLEIEPKPTRKRVPSVMSSDPARQAILRSRPGMNKPIFGKCLYPGSGLDKKKERQQADALP